MSIDILAIGAHPDDIELIIGGTIAKMVAMGKKVVILDLTRGELGTRGTPEERAEEARNAAHMLGIQDRFNLDLGDGRLENTFENRVKVIEQVRKYRPVLVMTHHWHDLHPDHCSAAELMKFSMYTDGMEKFPASGQPYRPNEVLFFMGHFHFEPSFIVDISDHFEKKLEAVRCYKSQLFNPEIEGKRTGISRPDFLEIIESRARHYGSLIQKKYGEPFFSRRPVPMADPVGHYQPFSKIH
jgi:N-acetylglucosamine malate deacetylase 1